ncbi:MAG: DUF4097 family beta strand repeat-containing protein [Candidatus Pelethousia sp.]|nr:DUF4097 family beta strand repeat-containing protein [Candidatus Pelethousia sp.]
MRTSIIIRIICWAALSICLLGLLLWGLAGNGLRALPFSFNFGRAGQVGFGTLEGEAGAYSPSNAYSVDAAGIERIKISWVDGDVTLTPYDGQTISFNETALVEIPEQYALRYALNGSTLTIHYSQGVQLLPSWHSAKSLEVLVPQALAAELGEVAVDAVSAGVRLSGIKCDRIGVDTTSGSIIIKEAEAERITMDSTSGHLETEGCTVADIEADTVSGAIKLQGAFMEVETDSVSGSVTITSDICPHEVNMDNVSGPATLLIPENQGFTARYDTISGGFRCDFPASILKNAVVYGDGSASFHITSVSGSIRIEQIG